MGKLIRVIIGIMFMLAFENKSFCQHRMPAPAPVRLRERVPMGGGGNFNRFSPQPNPGRKIELVKESFINQRLNLTHEQSRSFWPLYRQYERELMAVRIQKRLNNSSSSANGTEQIDRDFAFEQQLIAIKKHYKDEFLRILPPEKVSEIYKSERAFNDEVLKQLSERSSRNGD
jgi:hypothetical protein